MNIPEKHLENNSQNENKFEEFIDKAYEEINKDISKVLLEMRNQKQNRINNDDNFEQNFFRNENKKALLNDNINLTPNINNCFIKSQMNNNCIQNNLLMKNQLINHNNNEVIKSNNNISNNYPVNILINNSPFYNINIINNNDDENIDNKSIPYRSYLERRGLGLFNKEAPDNNIKIGNILKYKDKRTTLIIRNIPNKYNIALLLIELNEKFKNKFDMIFLPQDKIKDSNLGFGFINFLNPLSLILFYDEFMGKKWNYFNSPKRCFLAYSNFQGKNELINYVLKKLGIKNFNNINNNKILNEKIKKSLYINDIKNIKVPVEIPLKYQIKFENYHPYSSYYKKDDKVFIVEPFKK